MRKTLILTFVIALLLCACSSPNANHESAPTADEKKTVTAESLYEDFITQHEGNSGGSYTMYDMNGDDVPELIIKTQLELLVYWVKDGAVVSWYSDTAYTSPLNDGTLLSVREGAAPKHTDYIYQVLNYEGEVVYKLEFSEYEAATFQDVQYVKKHYINGIEVSEAAYASITEDILRMKGDNILWKVLSN